MATKIVTKNSSTASAVPTASDLVQGELAVNVADKRLFTEDNAGAIVELGTNPSGNVTFQDNGKAIFGAGSDLQIYHDGSNSYINDAGTGNLYLRASNAIIMQSADGAETIASFHDDNLCRLYFDNAIKLATTSTGIDVTGTATMDGLVVDGGAISTGDFTGTAAGSVRISGNGTTLGTTSFDLIQNSSGAYVYHRANLPLIFGTNNTERMRIDSSGQLLLGRGANVASGAEATRIQFYNTASTYDIASIRSLVGAGQVNRGELSFAVNNGAGQQERMRIDSSGNLLVGGTSAFGADTITLGTGGFAGIRNTSGSCLELRRDSTDGSILDFQKDGATVGSIKADAGSVGIGSGNCGLLFYDAGDRIIPRNGTSTSDASLDLGATTDRFKDLYLSGATKLFSNTNSPAANSTLGDVDFGARTDGTVTARVRGIAGSNGNGTDGQLTFYTASNTASQVAQERMRIDSAGNLLVGATAPDGDGISLKPRASAGSTSQINFDRASSATTGYPIVFQNGGVDVGFISHNNTSTTYNTSSDQRLKENIADADDAGSKIDAIQVRQYDWKADGSHQDYGMIAQELQTVAPEAVSGDADSEEMMGVDYSKLVPMLIKEIQSLRNRVAQLEE